MLAVAGGKGGCGKTTTTLGLAAALAGHRRRPVAVDADRDAPNLHLLAGVDADAAGTDGDDGPPATARPRPSSRWPGVRVVPGTRDADLRRTLAAVRDGGGPAVVDCPAGASRAVAVPLCLADASVVATTADPQSVEDALKTAAMARAVGTPVVGVVLARADRATDRLARAFDAPVVAVPEAAGRPLDDAGVRSAYDRLAGRVAPNA